MKQSITLLAFAALAATLPASAPWDHGPLRVSDNRRYLQHADDWVLVFDDASRRFNPPGTL